MVFCCGENEIVPIYEEGAMRLMTLIFMWLLHGACIASPEHRVFVSFSMPDHLLEETLLDATHHHMPVVLNGFYHDSMPETFMKIFELSKKIPDLSMQIDPTAYERYRIHQVPALVADNQQSFDVIFGNITIERGLEEIARFGDTRRVAP